MVYQAFDAEVHFVYAWQRHFVIGQDVDRTRRNVVQQLLHNIRRLLYFFQPHAVAGVNVAHVADGYLEIYGRAAAAVPVLGVA